MLFRRGWRRRRRVLLRRIELPEDRLKLSPTRRRVFCTNARRRVAGLGLREDGGEFDPQDFGDVVSGAEHGRADRG